MNRLIKLLLTSLFFILPFGQLTRLSLPYSINLYLHDLIIAASLILWLLTKPKIKSKLTQPIIIFIITAVISLLFSLTRFPSQAVLISSLYLIRWLLYASLYFILKDKKIKLPLTKLLLITSSIFAVFGLAQYFFLPDTRFLASLHWDDHYYRLISTLADPSYVGLILLLASILVIYTQGSIWLYLLYAIPLLLTYSRSSYLAIITTAIVWAVLKKKSKIIFITIILLVITLPFLPRPGGEGVKLERLYSITNRLANYQQGIDIFKTSPIFGIGFNTLRFYRNDFISHAASGLDSSLLFILVTTGITGFLAYLNLLKHQWQTSNLVKLSLTAILTHSFFQNSLFYPWIMIWLWVVLSIDNR